MIRIYGASALLLALLLPLAAQAQDLQLSPDTAVELSGEVLRDESAARDDLAGNVELVDTGSLPGSADLIAFHRQEDGDLLLALDRSAELGGAIVERGDVVRFDGSRFQLELNADAAGLPDGVLIDAVARIGTKLAFSFDTTLRLDGTVVEDEDLVRFDQGLTLIFDGSAAGVPQGLDLDGANRLEDDRLQLSFDGSGSIGGVRFDDEDVLEHDPDRGTWSLAYDGSARHGGWPAADLDGLFAPGSLDDRTAGGGCSMHPEAGPGFGWLVLLLAAGLLFRLARVETP